MVEHGRDVWQRLTQAAYANLDRDLAAAWVGMLEPGVRLRAVAGCGPGTRRGPLPQPRRRGGDADRQPQPAVAGWLGGVPLLPAGSAWPSWEGHGLLARIATVECAQLQPILPAQLKEAGFPDTGWLSFFYFDGSADGGVEVVGALFAGTGEGAQVRYTPPAWAVEACRPDGVTPYPKVEVTAEPVWTWPTWEHPRLQSGGRPADGWDQVFTAAEQIRQEQQAPPAHQIGGNPDPVQGPVELEAAYGELSRGGRDKIAWTDPLVRSAADDWILLGQFDTDSQAQFMWGDCGVLYYLIRPADLAARRFDQTVFTWQCS